MKTMTQKPLSIGDKVITKDALGFKEIEGVIDSFTFNGKAYVITDKYGMIVRPLNELKHKTDDNTTTAN